MGNGMNKILPGLYLSNYRDSRDTIQLTKNNITHIISIHDNAKPLHMDKKYLCINASDSADQDLLQYFAECIRFIHTARLGGGAVLIHCLAGVSRSVTITVAYVMSVTALGWREALAVVRASRSCASPNFGFQRQLHDYEFERVEEERKRLRTEFEAGVASMAADQEECDRVLEAKRLEDSAAASSPRSEVAKEDLEASRRERHNLVMDEVKGRIAAVAETNRLSKATADSNKQDTKESMNKEGVDGGVSVQGVNCNAGGVSNCVDSTKLPATVDCAAMWSALEQDLSESEKRDSAASQSDVSIGAKIVGIEKSSVIDGELVSETDSEVEKVGYRSKSEQ